MVKTLTFHRRKLGPSRHIPLRALCSSGRAARALSYDCRLKRPIDILELPRSDRPCSRFAIAKRKETLLTIRYSPRPENNSGTISRSLCNHDASSCLHYVRYDSQGHLTTRKVGLVEQSGSDVPTSEYAEYAYEYYPSTHTNKGLLKSEKDPLYNSSNATLHITEYEYNSQGRLTKITGSADTNGGSRPITQYTYSTAGNLATVTDPLSRVTSYSYDAYDQLTATTYPDNTTEQTLYGACSKWWHRRPCSCPSGTSPHSTSSHAAMPKGGT